MEKMLQSADVQKITILPTGRFIWCQMKEIKQAEKKELKNPGPISPIMLRNLHFTQWMMVRN